MVDGMHSLLPYGSGICRNAFFLIYFLLFLSVPFFFLFLFFFFNLVLID